MQPQETAPGPDFDFITKEQPAPKRQRFAGLGKPAKILIGSLAVLIIVTAAALLLGRGNTSSQQIVDLMAQNQEIIRVSQLQDEQFKDPNTKALATTTVINLQSQQQQLSNYIGDVSENQLVAKTDAATDSKLETAARNNTLDNTYIAYLKAALTAYQNSLTEIYQSTKSQTLVEILQSAFNSVDTLLKSPHFKS